jgi:hypothetical protein
MKKNATPRGKGSAKSSKAKPKKPAPKKPALTLSRINKAQTNLIASASIAVIQRQDDEAVKSTLPQIAARKAAFVSAMVQSLGVASKASLLTGIPLRTHRYWMAEDEVYRGLIAEMKEVALDFYEETLHQLIREKNVSAVIFALKTQGKRRGYIESVHQITQTFDDNNVTVFEIPDNQRNHDVTEAVIVPDSQI